MLRKLALLCFALVTLFVVSPVSISHAAPAAATNGDLAVLRSKMLVAQAALRKAGYTIREAKWNTLQLGDTTRYNGEFYAGNDYRIIGIGGPGIADLDIKLYDENGNVIDTDTSTDATPIVEVTPRWSGDFTIAINLYDLAWGESNYADYVYGYIIAYK